MQQSKSILWRSLQFRNQYNKISWQSSNPYNKRWQFKWKPAYYSYPRDMDLEHTRVKRPEDSWNAVPLGWAWFQDVWHRWVPGFKCLWDRRHRCYDKFNVYLLPAISTFFYQFWDLAISFKLLSVLPFIVIYTRCRDKVKDPDFKETYFRDIIYKNAELTELFNEETIHILDYDCEYDRGFQDPDKFPEFANRVFRFFNTDTLMTTGYFKMGDVESGAVMNLKYKTMPIPGKFRYQVGEPFYFYDIRAEITHNGKFKEVVIIDENETLKKVRPYVFLL